MMLTLVGLVVLYLALCAAAGFALARWRGEL